MARVFITGSSDGLGLMAAKLLIEQGHDVVLHGNDQRGRDARAAAQGAKEVVVGDFSTIAGTKSVADGINKLGRFNAVIHNAGIGYREQRRVETEAGVPSVFAVNVLAPYVLICLIERPDRLVYLSSGMHHRRAPADGRSCLEETLLEWCIGLCREQVLRRLVGFRGAALGKRFVKRTGAGLGTHQNGRSLSTR